jgi:hypothetical protein
MGVQVDNRFKGQATPINWRFNPLTGDDLAASKTENGITIPVATPFCLQLLEVPRKNTPASISVYSVTDGSYFAAVSGAPNAHEFRVDYPDPDGHGTGLVEFNSADQGKTINVVYMGTGSPAVVEYLQARMPLPAGIPGTNQGVDFDASGDPQWRYRKATYSWDRDVVYGPGGESDSSAMLWIKKESYHAKIKINLRGAKLHQAYYSELASHSHGGGGSHAHDLADHTHGAGSLDGSQPEHMGHDIRGMVSAGGEQVSIAGTTAGSGILTTGSASVSGGGDAGGNVKTYPNAFKVYIDGIDRTAALLTLASLAAFGDGTAGHAFVVTGSGELDISTYVSGTGMHTIEITEPTSGSGGRILAFIECY